MARIRSPNYPALSLPEAIKSVGTIQAAEQHLAAPKEVAAKHLGYASLHGLAARTISAIEKYGLLEEVSGDKVKVSPLAMSILFPSSPDEKQAAINEAAFKPALFAAIKEEWEGSRPSDENLRVYLIRKKFGSDALGRVIEVYKQTMDLVTPESGGYVAEKPDAKGQQQEKPMTPATHQPVRIQPPPTNEPYRVSFSPGGIEVSARLTDPASADELIRSINALKLLLKPISEIKEPDLK